MRGFAKAPGERHQQRSAPGFPGAELGALLLQLKKSGRGKAGAWTYEKRSASRVLSLFGILSQEISAHLASAAGHRRSTPRKRLPVGRRGFGAGRQGHPSPLSKKVKESPRRYLCLRAERMSFPNASKRCPARVGNSMPYYCQTDTLTRRLESAASMLACSGKALSRTSERLLVRKDKTTERQPGFLFDILDFHEWTRSRGKNAQVPRLAPLELAHLRRRGRGVSGN